MSVISMPCNKNRELTFTADIHMPFDYIFWEFGLEFYTSLGSFAGNTGIWNSSWGDTNTRLWLSRTNDFSEGWMKIWLHYEVRIGTETFEGSGLLVQNDRGSGFSYRDETHDIDGTITITANPVYCWEDYQVDTPSETGNRGYPIYPYQERNKGYFYGDGYRWFRNPTLKGGHTTGPLYSNITYYDKTGGDNSEAATEVTVGLDFGALNVEHVVSLETAELWTTAFGMMLGQVNNSNWIDGPPAEPARAMTVNAECNGHNYNCSGLLFLDENGYTYGTNGGLISIMAPTGGVSSNPTVTCEGYVHPNNPVNVKGQVALLGTDTWPDSEEYPKVRVRPLWKNNLVPYVGGDDPPYVEFFDDDSLELTNGALSTNLDLRFYSFNVWHRSRYDGYGTNTNYLSAKDEWNIGLVLEAYSATGGFNWLNEAHQYSFDWRVLGQDAWKTEPFKVQHKTTSVIPSSLFTHINWNWEGDIGHTHSTSSLSIEAGIDPVTLTSVASGWSFSDWRYLRFGCDQPVTVEMTYRTGTLNNQNPREWEWTTHKKTWNCAPSSIQTNLILENNANLQLQTSGNVEISEGLYCEIDLVAPNEVDFTRAEYDTSPWSNDKTDSERSDVRNVGQVDTPRTDGVEDADDMEFVPHAMLGVGMIDTLTIQIPASTTTTFSGAISGTVKDPREVDSVTITINPVYQLSDNTVDNHRRWSIYDSYAASFVQDEDYYWRYHPEGKRMVHGLVNFKECCEAPYAIESEFDYYQTHPTLMQSLIWMWDKNLGQDWTFTDVYDEDEDNPLRTNQYYPGLALCVSKEISGAIKHIYDQDVLTAPFQCEARLPADVIRTAPGIGDPQGEYGTYKYTFFKVMGSQMDGLTFKKSTYQPFPNSKVVVTLPLSGTSDAVYSNDWSYYRTKALHTNKNNEDNIYTITSSQMTSPVTGMMWPGRWNWISLMGILEASGGVSYLVSPNHRHYATWVQNDIVLLEIADNIFPLAWDEINTNIPAKTAAIAFKEGKPPFLVILTTYEGSGIYHKTSTEGKDFMSTVIFTDANQACIHITKHHIQYCYAITSTGGLIGQMRDGQNALMREFVVDADVDNVAMSAFESYGARGEWRISVLYSKAGEMRQKVSLDGITYY